MERSSGVMPSIAIAPESGRRNPSRQESSVVLPAPLGPIRPSVSPRATSRETPARARVERPRRPYVFETLETEIIESTRIAGTRPGPYREYMLDSGAFLRRWPHD